MRRLYVAPLATLHAQRDLLPAHLTTHYLSLFDTGSDSDYERWRVEGSPVAISTEILSESAQEAWERHPHVTVLPDPIYSGSVSLLDARNAPENRDNAKFDPHHSRRLPPGTLIDGFDHLATPKNIGVVHADTVIDVHRKLAAHHSGFRLRAFGH